MTAAAAAAAAATVTGGARGEGSRPRGAAGRTRAAAPATAGGENGAATTASAAATGTAPRDFRPRLAEAGPGPGLGARAKGAAAAAAIVVAARLRPRPGRVTVAGVTAVAKSMSQNWGGRGGIHPHVNNSARSTSATTRNAAGEFEMNLLSTPHPYRSAGGRFSPTRHATRRDGHGIVVGAGGPTNASRRLATRHDRWCVLVCLTE